MEPEEVEVALGATPIAGNGRTEEVKTSMSSENGVRGVGILIRRN